MDCWTVGHELSTILNVFDVVLQMGTEPTILILMFQHKSQSTVGGELRPIDEI